MLNSRHKILAQFTFRAFRLVTILITIAILMSACSPVVTEPTLDIQATLAANVSGTLTAAAPIPTHQLPTLAPFPTYTQSPQPTASYSGLPALVNVTSIILRSGPSTLFEKITTFPQGTEVTIMGKISNAEWVWVITPKASAGWMSAQFLSQVDLSGVPVVFVPSSITIIGNAMDTNNIGVDGLDVAVFQGNGADQRRTDTYTELDGSFTVYLPESSQGTWYVETVGTKCTSRIMDANCNHTGSITNPAFTVSLPQTVNITFIYDPNQP